MERTITTHNGSDVSREHNIRAPYVVAKETHINTALSSRNEILIDIPLKQAYAELFDAARIEYNKAMIEKGHPERQINDYLAKIRKDKKKHPVYEMIVQIGNRDDTGVDGDVECECIREFIAGWEKRNPNLRLIGAYIHADEDNGTLHAHLDYIPVAYNCSRGMKTQTALVQALGAQGFVGVSTKQTAQIAWEKRENEALEQICISHGITVVHPKTGEQHRDKPQFIEYQKQLDEIRGEIGDKRQEAEQLNAEVSEKNAELTDTAAALAKSQAQLRESTEKVSQIQSIDSIETKKSLFGGKVTVAQEDFDKVSDLAKKQIAVERRDDGMIRQIEALTRENRQLTADKESLTEQNAQLRKENGQLQSVSGKIAIAKLRSERDNLQCKLDKVLEFIEKLGLMERLRAFFPAIGTVIKGQRR